MIVLNSRHSASWQLAFLFSVLMPAYLLFPGHLSAEVILVPGTYPEIQTAIDHAATGDLILVSPGAYHENIVIDKGIRLLGSGADVTRIYPAVGDLGPAGGSVFGNSQVIVIAASDVVVYGLTIDGDSPYYTPLGELDARNGIITDYTSGDWSGCELQDVVVQNTYMSGVYLRGAVHSADNSITDVVVSQVNALPLQSAGITLYDASGTINGCDVSFCELGIRCLSGSGAHVYDNTVTDNAIGIQVMDNGESVEVGAGNTVTDYEMVGIELREAAAPINVHDNEVSCTMPPGAGGSAAVGIFGQSPSWSGIYMIENNSLLGPAGVSESYGVRIDTYSSMTQDVHARLADNHISDFDVGILLADGDGNPSAWHDVVIGADSLRVNFLGGNGSFALQLNACDDTIDATWNDWGVYTPEEIELEVYHDVDDPVLGHVTFWPTWGVPSSLPVGRSVPTTWGLIKSIFRVPGE